MTPAFHSTIQETTMKKIRLLAAAAAATLGATFAPLALADLTIGVSISLTGPTSALGIPTKNGIALWPKEIAGQKLNVIVTAALAFLFTLTGFFLWYGERNHAFRLQNALVVHDWLMYISFFLVLGHLYLSLVNPSTRHSLSGITRGWVREDWALKHHAKWARAVMARDDVWSGR
jgi:hypothetical protein